MVGNKQVPSLIIRSLFLFSKKKKRIEAGFAWGRRIRLGQERRFERLKTSKF
jgi:hypothetical protein